MRRDVWRVSLRDDRPAKSAKIRPQTISDAATRTELSKLRQLLITTPWERFFSPRQSQRLANRQEKAGW